jgi:hypothetical protein
VKGVEHQHDARDYRLNISAKRSLMPKGVEHINSATSITSAEIYGRNDH